MRASNRYASIHHDFFATFDGAAQNIAVGLHNNSDNRDYRPRITKDVKYPASHVLRRAPHRQASNRRIYRLTATRAICSKLKMQIHGLCSTALPVSKIVKKNETHFCCKLQYIASISLQLGWRGSKALVLSPSVVGAQISRGVGPSRTADAEMGGNTRERPTRGLLSSLFGDVPFSL